MIAEGTQPGKSLLQLSKRTFDIVFSLIALIILLPVLALIAVVIKLETRGPALFKQRRVGLGGEEFTLYKFRSMQHNCSDSRHREYMEKFISSRGDDSLRAKDGSFKMDDDPRVTRAGRILRKTSLDELPQLINVLKGEMSLVGPRPAIMYEVERYEPWQMERLAVKPGITGLWQVTGRSGMDFYEMVKLDLEYIESRSFFLDLRILVKTIGVVFKMRGAW